MKNILRIIFFTIIVGITNSGFGQVSDELEPDIDRKEKEAKALVGKAVAYFSKPEITVGQACYDFLNDLNTWRQGDIFLFVIASNGTIYAYGENSHTIWQDLRTGERGQALMGEMLKRGDVGDWIDYSWDNATQHAYVKTVRKDNQTYIIGAGFFPESPRYLTQELVKEAVQSVLEEGSETTFNRMNNPRGAFVRGNLYLFAFTLEGVCVAHGENFALVNQNVMEWKDATGRFRYKEMIRFAEQNGKGWFEYIDKGANKIAYVETVSDPETKKTYVIGGGYYPDINDETVREFVQRAVAYLKAHGKDAAEKMYSGREMLFGSLRPFMYDMEGNVIADAETPEFVGQNLMGFRDPEGKFVMKNIVDQAKKFERGWVSYYSKGAYKMVYLERVNVPGGTYIVGSGYFPTSKVHWTKSMVEKAADMLKSHDLGETLQLFTSKSREFLRGDLYVFAYDAQGYCLAAGPYKEHIWHDTLLIKRDTKGKNIADQALAQASAGGGWIEFDIYNGKRRTYVMGIEKENPTAKKTEFYMIGVGYFI